MEFRSRLTDDLTDNRATVKPPGLYEASTCVPKHNVQVVTNENFSLTDGFKLDYKKLTGRPITFEEPLNYQTMVGDGIVQSGQEYVSTSSGSINTNGLEQDGVIYVETTNCSEQLKVSMGVFVAK